MAIDLWRTKYHTINGFRQFYRERQPRDELDLPVLALHGSLTQSGMWVALAEAADSIRMLCPDQRGFGLSEDPGNDLCACLRRARTRTGTAA
jgi:pimeloyl-ACP methyl ester carboxylesterase